MPDTLQLPRLQKQDGATRLLVDNKPYLILGGEIHNSSASCLKYMEEHVWDKLVALNCNTALVPCYWELVEPEEGFFDFALIDGLLDAARKRNLRLIPLWFGTWKNAMSTYAPEWVKLDRERFPRAALAPGKYCGAISPLSTEAMRADSRAFAAVMKHLREVDAEQQTVIMMQVENEAGLLGAPRDRSPLAEKAFAEQVPQELLLPLLDRKERLHPELLAELKASGHRESGTWAEVFGPAADEAFMAWHIAKFIDEVAVAGQNEYPLPCFANAWIVQYPGEKPGKYPSGGPVARVRDIWQIAAPSMALLAPDIYLDDFAGICAEYADGGNPLLIPEARRSAEAASNVFYALGKHNALGFAPFGIESIENDPLFSASYGLLEELTPFITTHQSPGQMTAVLQGSANQEVLTLGNYRIEVLYHAPLEVGKAPATAIIIAESPDSFIVAGHGGVDINFHSTSHQLPNVDFLRLEEGSFRGGEWHAGRRMNGDEYVVRFRAQPSTYRAHLYRYE